MSPTVDAAATLVRLANRIGEFFEAMPEREQALHDVAEHIRKFWEPRMRRALLEHLDDAGSDGLLPIVRDAVREHREALMPTSPA